MESLISKKISEELGYKWIFIEYTNEIWESLYDTDLRRNYDKFAGGCSTIAHLQDYPAVLEMKIKNLIPEDSIFIPGHAGDFIAGSHIPLDIFFYKINYKSLEEIILKKHYGLKGINRIKKEEKEIIKAKIAKTFDFIEKIENFDDLANYFEYWDWQERQAKFIANAVRVYEYFGYDFRMPFWDDEVLKFFMKLPLNYRLNKELYNEYVENITKPFISIPSLKKKTNLQKEAFKKILYKVKLLDLAKLLKYKLKEPLYKKEYYGHFLSWYGIMNEKEFKKIYSGLDYNCHYLFRAKDIISNL